MFVKKYRNHLLIGLMLFLLLSCHNQDKPIIVNFDSHGYKGNLSKEQSIEFASLVKKVTSSKAIEQSSFELFQTKPTAQASYFTKGKKVTVLIYIYHALEVYVGDEVSYYRPFDETVSELRTFIMSVDPKVKEWKGIKVGRERLP